jgi:hypothetical protein
VSWLPLPSPALYVKPVFEVFADNGRKSGILPLSSTPLANFYYRFLRL